MKNQLLLRFLLTSVFSLSCMASFSREPNRQYFSEAKNYEGSSELVDLRYHMGPVLANPISLYVIWYGHWNPTHQSTIRDFINSLSPHDHDHHDDRDPFPSVADWWRTVRLYADQTGSNVTGSIVLSGEFEDLSYSHGDYLSRLAIQYVINHAVTASNPRAALPLNPRDGLYLVLTSPDVRVQDFCRAVCGFHYFTFPTIAGVTVPYAWVGHSGKQCPGLCAYPFAWPDYSKMPPPGGGGIGGGGGAMRPPNGDAGTDGMISVLAHELAEVCSNPLVNAWYAGEDPTAPTEIADLCVGVYGSGGGGGYVGRVYRGKWGIGYNLNGVRGRKFLVQWVWDPVKRRCFGPNAID